MKAHLIDTHLLVPRSRSSAKVKVKYQGHISQKMGVSGALVFLLFFTRPVGVYVLARKFTWKKKSELHSKYNVPLTLSQTTNFRLFQIERFADDNFEFEENGRKFSKRLENTVGKGEIAHYEQFLLFPQCFQRTSAAEK